MQSKITKHESKINEYITEHGSLGAKIRLMRQQAGLTRSYLSELSTIPEVTIRSWESNKRTPSLVNLNKLILVFKKFNIEVNLSWFRDNYFRKEEKIINKAQNILFNPELFAQASSNVLSYIKKLRSKPTLFDVQRKIEQEYMKILLENSTKKDEG